MRILHLLDHLGLGGAQTALAALLEAWPAESDQISVVGLGCAADLRAQLRQTSAVVDVRTLDGNRWSWRPVTQAAAVLREGQFDIVHTHLCKSICTALWARSHFRSALIAQLHSDLRRDYLPVRLALRRWHSRLDLLVGVSRHTTDAAARTLDISSAKLHTIHAALRAQRTSTAACAPRPWRKPAFVVGFAGRLAAEKGLTYLLQAQAQLQRQQRPLATVFIGDGPLRGPLEQEAAERGLRERVVFAGRQAEPAAWISACDVLVFPSLTEGLPMAVVEAMALGVPVVASHVGGVPEVIRQGETGLLVAPRNVADLCRAISALADSPPLRQRLAETARREIVPRFQPHAVARQWRDLYRSLLSATPARSLAGPPAA